MCELPDVQSRLGALERDMNIMRGSADYWMKQAARWRRKHEEADRDLQRIKRLEQYQVDQRVRLENALHEIVGMSQATSGSWVNVLLEIRTIAHRALDREPEGNPDASCGRLIESWLPSMQTDRRCEFPRGHAGPCGPAA
jgi:hypothetical protein